MRVLDWFLAAMLGSLPDAGGPLERFREVLKRDIAKWQNVVSTAGIKRGG